MSEILRARKTGRMAAAGLAVAALALAAAGCGGGGSSGSTSATKTAAGATAGGSAASSKSTLGSSAKAAAKAHTLVYADAGEPSTIDPAIANVNQENHVTWNIYDGLTSYPIKNAGKTTPWLATSWTVKGKVWTFNLRKGVKFQDGQLFTAADVKASLDRTLKINQGDAYLISVVKNVKVLNPYKVQITTKTPNTFLASNLSHIGIVSAADIKAHAKGNDLAQGWFQNHANGTGPYKFVSWQKGTQLVLAKNTSWWGKFAPNAPNKVIDQFVADGATRARGLEGGAYNFADFVPVDDVLRIAKKPGFHLVSGNQLFTWPAIYLNMQTAPTSDANFRKALVDVFDYNAETVFFKGHNTVPRGPLPAWFPGSPANQFPPIKQNISAAKQALVGAKTSSKSMTCAVPSGYPEFDFAATNLQSAAQQLGITVNIRTMPFVQAINAVKHNQAQCFVLGEANLSPADPTGLFSSHEVSGAYYNTEHYSSKTFDSLVNKISETFDAKQRAQLVKRAFGMVRDTHAIIWTSQPPTLYAVPNYITGFEVDPASYTGIRFAEMSINK
jgi:peptide/nickel transport system substrate-binding protein